LVATTSYKVRNSGPVWSSTPHGAVRPGMAAYVGRPPGAAARRVRTARARPSPGAFRPFPSTASTCVAMRADGAVSGGERSRARMNGSSAQPPSSARPRCRSPPCLRGSAGLPRHERVHCRALRARVVVRKTENYSQVVKNTRVSEEHQVCIVKNTNLVPEEHRCPVGIMPDYERRLF